MENDISVSKCDNELVKKKLEQFYNGFNTNETNGLVFNFMSSHFFYLKQNNVIIGIASIEDEDYAYNDFKRFISPEFRSKKFGETLLDYIIEDAKKMKKSRLTGSFKNNQKVSEYFKSKGFTVSEGDPHCLIKLSLK